MLNTLGSLSCEEEPSETVQVESNYLRALSQVSMPRQLGQDHIAEFQSLLEWPEVELWVVDVSKKKKGSP